jgi:hypothetical protein
LDSQSSDAQREESDMRSPLSEIHLRDALSELHMHPDDTASLIRYAPAALAHLCWRNSVIEDWHAGPQSRISDADVMRASVATTRIFHQALTDALSPTLAETGPYSADSFDPEDLSHAFCDAFDIAFDPNRVLPHGVSLSALAGDELEELRKHASQQLDTLLDVAWEEGVHLVLMWLALRGKLAVPNWWGTPNWPFVVDEFFRAFSDPRHEHWPVRGHPGEPPVGAGTPDQLRRRLIVAPEEMASEILEFYIHKGQIGHIQLRRYSRTVGTERCHLVSGTTRRTEESGPALISGIDCSTFGKTFHPARDLARG